MGCEGAPCWILQLSDCVLLEILCYLDATSLYLLSKTCTYFENIIQDVRLWKYVDARREPNTNEKVEYCCDQLNRLTKYVFFRARSKKEGVIGLNSMGKLLGLRHLTVLSLENQKFNGSQFSMKQFPPTLEELSLKKTHIKHAQKFFNFSYTSKVNLRVLILDECNWLESSFIISVSKFPRLELISIAKCYKLHYNIVPYLSIAMRGCKRLKLLDCRFSTVSNDFLMAFSQRETMLALYFQSMRSHQIDTGKSLVRNTDRLSNLTRSELSFTSQNSVSNRSLIGYRNTLGGLVEELPESILYEDPYPPCKCSFEQKIETESDNNITMDDFVDFHSCNPQKFICRKHVNDVKNLPTEFRKFFVMNRSLYQSEYSDSDSDSDSEGVCCMIGRGRVQQMIVLKVRERDSEGNIPPPEVINLCRNDKEGNATETDDSVQRAASSQTDGSGGLKRKNEEGGESSKKPKFSDCADSQAGTSKGSKDGETRKTSGMSSSDVGGLNAEAPQNHIEHQLPNIVVDVGQLREDIIGGYVPDINYFDDNDDCDCDADLIKGKVVKPKKKLRLRRLSLRGYRQITDTALSYLRDLNIDLLDVTHTSVTKEGILEFLLFNPDCRVLHKDFCTCQPKIPC